MSAIKPYITCDLFQHDVDVSAPDFLVRQQELLLHPTQQPHPTFRHVDVDYRCSFQLQNEGFDARRPFILIPSRDNVPLLKHTLTNLLEKQVDAVCNIMVVDDRSTEDYRPLVTDLRRVSYLRVDNGKGFNFSMLCNIGAYVAKGLGCGEVILWNNDVWIEERSHLERVIRKHREDDAVISGVKLLYPLRSFDGATSDSLNIMREFPAMIRGRWRGTVQFGGSAWGRGKGPILLTPVHRKRFASPDHYIVNDDHAEIFVTGAFQLIRLAWYMKTGGMNPSLAATLQDVDLCLRASIGNDRVMYYGKNLHFWHNESLSLHSESSRKNDLQFVSDRVLFGKLWNGKMPAILQ